MLLMKLSHFIAGAQVRDLYDRSHQGQVLTPTDTDGMVEVRWDDGTISTVDGDELRVVDPAAEAKMVQDVQAKLDEATSAFESAFKAFQDAKDLVVDDSKAEVASSSLACTSCTILASAAGSTTLNSSPSTVEIVPSSHLTSTMPSVSVGVRTCP